MSETRANRSCNSAGWSWSAVTLDEHGDPPYAPIRRLSGGMGPSRGGATDEGEHLGYIDRAVGVDLKHGPSAGDRFGDLVVPQFVRGADGVEVPSVACARSAAVPLVCDRLLATAEDLDKGTGQ
jgi:hypothetical protein